MPEHSTRTLPASWVDRIFDRMQGRYGSLWLDRWRTGDIDSAGRDRGLLNAKATWCEELGGFADQPERIHRAIESCRHMPLPPTLPEFLEQCRQAMPVPLAALPAPKVSPAVARDRAEKLQERAGQIASKTPGHDHKKWARDILADPKKYPAVSVRMAHDALGKAAA